MSLDKERVLPIIRSALKEDIGKGDITTLSLIDKFVTTGATIVAKEDCVVCGLQVAEWLMAHLDYSVRFKPNCSDGDFVGQGKEVAVIEGHAGSILRAERTMLNFLSFLSGISTTTKKFVDKAKPYGVKVMDTRKTIPLMRYLEKYAVTMGGGTNHRMGLYDQVLIKDNHIVLTQPRIPLSVVVREARKNSVKGVVIEVEVETVDQFTEVIGSKPDIIMLDNMTPRNIMACLDARRLSKIKPLIEVSGGITLDTIEEYAKTRVDMISVGSLTNSIKPVDMSLDIV
ncbi:MAG: carboxylating nicotinate-nucleotide diphosphorylase [Candidatus Omnitrophota bacterium]|jgi:nicotinate-nucleotide pyrophosphorylase (carboxylating)